MTDTLLILSIIIGLIAILRPRRQPDLLSDDRDVFATNLIIMLSFLDSQDEIKALDAVYRTTKADLIRYGKTLDQGFLTQCLIITENYYQSCRAKLQQNGPTDIASLN